MHVRLQLQASSQPTDPRNDAIAHDVRSPEEDAHEMRRAVAQL